MLISKIHLPRRTVLKALGATVGLPLLEAMIPAATALASTAAVPRPRVSFVYFPHGAVMDQWTPQGDALSPILAPLAAWRRSLTVVSGLENKSAQATPVHARTASTWLTCTAPQAGGEAKAAVSVDQLAARKWGRQTRFESLQLATESAVQPVSTALPTQHDPRDVFAHLFGSTRSDSVLDLVRQDAADLSRKVGPRDRATLDDYFANVRDVERRIQTLEVEPAAFDDRVRLMFDLLVLAYRADLTRVATFMMAAEASEQVYDFAGVPEAFHALSHHGNSVAKLERLARVQAYNTQLFAGFVARLAATPDGDGSLLDHSLIVYGSNMSDSNRHDHSNLPLALVGGQVRGGPRADVRHVRCEPRTPLANLYVASLNNVGLPTPSFADSTAAVALS